VKKVRVSAFFVRVCVAGRTQGSRTDTAEKLGVAAVVIYEYKSIVKL
jgi:hypothetical protein